MASIAPRRLPGLAAALVLMVVGYGTAAPAHAANAILTPVTATVGVAIPPVSTLDTAALVSPVTWSTSPSLPAGLSLDTAGGPTLGVISGTPTVASPTTVVTVSATDGSIPPVTVSIDVPISVDGTMSIPDVSGIVGEPVSGTPTIDVKGLTAPITFTAPTAPAWLSILAGGVLSGTPDAALATTSIPVVATDASGAKATSSVALTVVPAMVPTTQVIEARVGAALAKSSIAYPKKTGVQYDISPSVSATTGLDFDPATGVVSGTPTHPLTTTVFTVDQVSDIGVTVGRARISVTVIGVLAATPQTILGTVGSPIAPFAGCGTTTAVAAGLAAPLSFGTSPDLPGVASPGDLAIDAASGVLSGRPSSATAGTKYTVIATDVHGATATCAVITVINGTLAPLSQILFANTSTLTSSSALIAAGMADPISYSVSPTLPAGLSLNPATGAVSGIARLTRITAVFTVVATDRNGATASAIVTISVGKPLLTPPVITALVPGSEEGTLQVFFSPPAFAPSVQTYAVNVYAAGDLAFVTRVDAVKSPVSIGELEPGKAYQVVVVANATAFFDRVESLPKLGVASRATLAFAGATSTTTSVLGAATVLLPVPNVAALARAGIRLAPSISTRAQRVALTAPASTALKTAPTVRVPRNRYVRVVVPGVQSTDPIVISIKVRGTWLVLGSAEASRSLALALPAVSVASAGNYTLRLSGQHMRSMFVMLVVT